MLLVAVHFLHFTSSQQEQTAYQTTLEKEHESSLTCSGFSKIGREFIFKFLKALGLGDLPINISCSLFIPITLLQARSVNCC